MLKEGTTKKACQGVGRNSSHDGQLPNKGLQCQDEWWVWRVSLSLSNTEARPSGTFRTGSFYSQNRDGCGVQRPEYSRNRDEHTGLKIKSNFF